MYFAFRSGSSQPLGKAVTLPESLSPPVEQCKVSFHQLVQLPVDGTQRIFRPCKGRPEEFAPIGFHRPMQTNEEEHPAARLVSFAVLSILVRSRPNASCVDRLSLPRRTHLARLTTICNSAVHCKTNVEDLALTLDQRNGNCQPIFGSIEPDIAVLDDFLTKLDILYPSAHHHIDEHVDQIGPFGYRIFDLYRCGTDHLL